MKHCKFILLFFVAAACDLAVEVDIPFEKKLVVNCIIHPDSIWTAHISNNKHVLSSLEYDLINDATVVMYENDLPVDTLQSTGNGHFRSDSGKPKPGETYEIKVQAGSHDQILAETVLPNPAPISSVQIIETEGASGDKETEVKIKFLDNVSEKNFYQIQIFSVYDALREDFKVVRYYTLNQLTYDDPTALQDNNFDWKDGTLLEDILFNGKEKEVILKADTQLDDAIVVEVRTINEDYFNYFITKAIQGKTDHDPLAQPINGHNNIQNGSGIFAGYSSSTFLHGSDVRPEIKSAYPMETSVGNTVTLTVENLNLKSMNDDRLNVLLKSSVNGQYEYCPVTIKSENTIEIRVPDGAVTGKIAIALRGLTGVSDFELEIID